MRIFLTGATGYVGSAVMDALLRSGHEVTALVRDPEKADAVTAAFMPMKKLDLETIKKAGGAR